MASGGVDQVKYHCNYCIADCSGLRVSCAECPDFDACLQCFASGAEMGHHKRGHNYRLIDNGTFHLICEEWTADEEMLLLDGIEQHGLGNWEDIADHIGTKTDEEAKSHFEEVYLCKNIGKATLPKTTSDIPDHSLHDGCFSPTIAKPPDPIDIPMSEQQEVGYMMLRDDFEREYDNDAETNVKSLVCSRDDDELETALKLSIADMYWRVLKERSRWKKVARTYGLITSKHKLIASRRKLSKEDREFKDKIRVFAQFLPLEQWEELLANRIREKELREKILEHIRFRSNGIKKLTGVGEFEELSVQREKKKEAKKRMQVISPPRTTKTSGKVEETDEEGNNTTAMTVSDKESSSVYSNFKEKMKSNPCYNLLSDKEKQWCCCTQINCGVYFTLKTYMLNQYASQRLNVPFKSKPPPSLTPLLRNTLQEFFMQCGWMGD